MATSVASDAKTSDKASARVVIIASVRDRSLSSRSFLACASSDSRVSTTASSFFSALLRRASLERRGLSRSLARSLACARGAFPSVATDSKSSFLQLNCKNSRYETRKINAQCSDFISRCAERAKGTNAQRNFADADRGHQRPRLANGPWPEAEEQEEEDAAQASEGLSDGEERRERRDRRRAPE